ncbi:MAG: tRNA (adenosine(37)-N6)-threonylcarbamoyltransferase complex ATPase subunit type 1 TsaE [Prevotella sp.]|nr:tRNA (adenosine(37)-N6)-threonylcarbamoyltransferase complex ATPase subunit type 1 TsaE [Prevotella sp.]
MGAGKTTFISAIARELGVSEPVTSPTFAIVNEYTVPPLPLGGRQGGSTLYHFDFYRIKSLQEALDIGIEDYFYSGNLCLIEWPELIEPLLPNSTIHVTIAVNPDGSRDIIPSKELKEKL